MVWYHARSAIARNHRVAHVRREQVDVRVGIVSFNTAELLDRCLRAVPAALGDLSSEVKVVDNASHDHSAEVIARHPDVEVQRNPINAGYASAMNDALEGTAAPVLIALNPDTEPPPGSLRALVARLHADLRTGLVVPRLVAPDGELQPSVHRFPSVPLALVANFVPARALRGALGRRFWIDGAVDHQSTTPIDWAFGAVHVMRRAASGPRPYDERFFMYAEDLDLCWRLHRDGWKVELDGDVEVPHVGNAAGGPHWGAARESKVWAATYEWYARSVGAVPARAYAAINAVGSIVKGAANRTNGRLRHDPQASEWGAHLLRAARSHVRGMVKPRAR